MPYTKNPTWVDAPSTDTLVTADALNHMEDGIEEGARAASTTQTGNVELATAGEMDTGTDTVRVPPVKVVADYVAANTATPSKADIGLGNVDNTSDATKNAATAVLTNKTLDFDFDTTGNVAENIPMESVDGLVSALDSVGFSGLPYVVWGGSSYPARALSGTVDPAIPVLWIRGPGPSMSGTGATGATVGDLWLRAV